MIDHIRGMLDKKGLDHVVVEAGGIGYKIYVPLSVIEKLPEYGEEVKLFAVESVAMYGGSTTLYGFFSEEERDLFLLLKDEVPGAGAKKALDYLDKITKSLPDFKRCVLSKDTASLTGIFGFTKKTAEKISAALKDKIGRIQLPGKEKWDPSGASTPAAEAIAGLMALGYRETPARAAVEQALNAGEKTLSVEEIIRKSLRFL